MTKREACAWVHVHMVVDRMSSDELLAAFIALAGHAPTAADRASGLFRRCGEIVLSTTGVQAQSHGNTLPRARKSSVS